MVAGAFLFSGTLCAQGFLIDRSYIRHVDIKPANQQQQQQQQQQTNNSDDHYDADIQLMMEYMKQDPNVQATMQQLDNGNGQVWRPGDPTPSWMKFNTITINGVTSTPGLEASLSTSSAAPRVSKGHITRAQLDNQITRTNKSEAAFRANPNAWSYLYWQSNEKLLQTYQESLKP